MRVKPFNRRNIPELRHIHEYSLKHHPSACVETGYPCNDFPATLKRSLSMSSVIEYRKGHFFYLDSKSNRVLLTISTPRRTNTALDGPKRFTVGVTTTETHFEIEPIC